MRLYAFYTRKITDSDFLLFTNMPLASHVHFFIQILSLLCNFIVANVISFFIAGIVHFCYSLFTSHQEYNSKLSVRKSSSFHGKNYLSPKKGASALAHRQNKVSSTGCGSHNRRHKDVAVLDCVPYSEIKETRRAQAIRC